MKKLSLMFLFALLLITTNSFAGYICTYKLLRTDTNVWSFEYGRTKVRSIHTEKGEYPTDACILAKEACRKAMYKEYGFFYKYECKKYGSAQPHHPGPNRPRPTRPTRPIEPRRPSRPETISQKRTCKSNGQTKTCKFDKLKMIKSIKLKKKLYGRCRKNLDYGFKRGTNKMWVRNDCKGKFRATGPSRY